MKSTEFTLSEFINFQGSIGCTLLTTTNSYVAIKSSKTIATGHRGRSYKHLISVSRVMFSDLVVVEDIFKLQFNLINQLFILNHVLTKCFLNFWRSWLESLNSSFLFLESIWTFDHFLERWKWSGNSGGKSRRKRFTVETFQFGYNLSCCSNMCLTSWRTCSGRLFLNIN